MSKSEFSFVNGDICKTVRGGGHGSMDRHSWDIVEHNLRIRKLTPKECFRLMAFDDEDFHKAKWMKESFYLQGGRKKYSAKLKAVKEKPLQKNMETYVLCTTNDSKDMEILKTITSKSAKMQENENLVSVNIVIERLENLEHLVCATNIIKCIDYMGMHFTLIPGKDLHQMDIIVWEKTVSTNIGRYMKITTESNLDQTKLYTILTLTALIIKSKIFTCTIQSAIISGFTTLIEDSENNIQMNVSNLKMECTKERVSNSELYKQAGNSIVVSVVEYLLLSLLDCGALELKGE